MMVVGRAMMTLMMRMKLMMMTVTIILMITAASTFRELTPDQHSAKCIACTVSLNLCKTLPSRYYYYHPFTEKLVK